MMLPGVDFGIVTENQISMIILLIIDFAILRALNIFSRRQDSQENSAVLTSTCIQNLLTTVSDYF